MLLLTDPHREAPAAAAAGTQVPGFTGTKKTYKY
jgi:hypothetical protein